MIAEQTRKILLMGIVNLTDDSFYEDSRLLASGSGLDPGFFLSKIDSIL